LFPIGSDRVGIVTVTAVLDGDGNPVVDELMEPETTTAVTWKDGCSFQLLSSTEDQSNTTTTSATVRVVMPVDDDTRGLTSASILRYPHPDGDDYVMRGNPFLERDQRGREQYVYGDCERQTG
jgi:hypothetical protein